MPWLLAGCWAGEVDFVRRLPFEGTVRAMLVVPLHNERCFSLILRSIFRYRGQLQDALERSVESLDNGNAAMFVDGTEPRQNIAIFAPLLFKVRTLEFALLDRQ